MFDVQKYKAFVEDRWVTKAEPLNLQISIASLGIGGESGEVLEAISLLDRDKVVTELGDVLFYVFTLSRLLESPTTFAALLGIDRDNEEAMYQYSKFLESSKKHSTSYHTLIIETAKVQEHIKKYLRNPSKCPVNKDYLFGLFNTVIYSIIWTASTYASASLEDVVASNYKKLNYRAEEGSISDLTRRT